MKRAYGSTDDEILENVAGSRGGSTAVTAIVINGETLIVANVGDSRAVLCRKGVAEQITVDHEPQKEEKLVESKGGFVTKAPGIHNSSSPILLCIEIYVLPGTLGIGRKDSSRLS